MKLIQLIRILALALIPLTALGVPAKKNYSTVRAVELQCEYLETPMGIDVTAPLLSWKLTDSDLSEKGKKQAAFQVIVASSAENAKKGIGDVYDTQKVASDEMKYFLQGVTLKSSSKYWWRIKVWDEHEVASEWSAPSYWITGMMNEDKWQAEWITADGAEKYAAVYKSARTDFYLDRYISEVRQKMPKPGDTNYSSLLAEKEIVLKPNLTRALIHISGLGQYELTINGKKIGDYLLTPGWSDYTKTVLYDTYEVTNDLKKGKNTLSVLLGNGMYNIQADTIRYVKFLNTFGPLKLIAQLQLEYSDGTKEIIGTDKTWKVAPGPITYSNLFGGEDFDSRRVPNTEWYEPVLTKGPGGALRGVTYAAPAIKEIETLKPIRITAIKPNVFIYDLGQNTAVMPRIQVKGGRGSYVRIIPSELLGADGLVDRTSSAQNGIRPAWWQYTLSGTGKESWFPQFFYQGARYFQVELFANEDGEWPVIQALNGVVVHASSTPIGTFECSNELFNRIYDLVRWAQRSNMMSIMTDCPAREKLGWLEQTQLNGPALRYNFNMAPLFRKTMNDMTDSQLGYGLIPNIAPEFFMAEDPAIHPPRSFRNSPEWGSASIFIPWHQYLFSGDISLLHNYYDVMKRYLSFLAASAVDNIVYTGLGDWYDIGPKKSWGSQLTPPALTATAMFYYDHVTMSKIAGILGNKNDEIIYRLKAEEIKESFNDTFLNKETGTYSTNSQSANAMPLALGLVDAAYEASALTSIVKDIKKHDNSHTSGEVGFRFLLQVLAAGGYSDLIYTMHNQSDKPGYGYQLKKGATSLTERWDPADQSMGSQNHFMMGQINEWFFNDLAGIQPDESGPGFRKFRIKPTVVGDLEWVKASYDSFSGRIVSEWKRNDKTFHLRITVPVNTTATVYLPSEAKESVTESGAPLHGNKTIRYLRTENGYTVYEVESGNYSFACPMH